MASKSLVSSSLDRVPFEASCFDEDCWKGILIWREEEERSIAVLSIQGKFRGLAWGEAACGSCECDDGKFAATALEGPGSAAIRLESLCCCAMETGSAKYQLAILLL